MLNSYNTNWMLKYFLLFVILSCAQLSWAQQRLRGGTMKTTKIGLSYSNYTGPDNTSFSKGSPAFGIDVSIDDGGKYFRYFFKASADYASGSQAFSKNAVVYTSKYEFFAIAPEIGVAVYPVARRDRGLNIYLYGSGQVSYNYLNIMTIPSTVTGVNAKSQEFGAGFGGGIGVEVNWSGGMGLSSVKETAGRNVLFAELGFTNSYAPLAGQIRFELSRIKGTIGYGF